MAVNEKMLQEFFNKQKKPEIDSLLISSAPKKSKKQTISKPTQTVSKPLANHEQTVSNVIPKPLAVREQTVSKPLAVREQTVSSALAKPLAKDFLTVSKALAKDIDELVGNESTFLLYIFQKCQLIGSLETPPITTEELKKFLDISAEHARNLVFRLTKKGFIEKTKVKNGKSSWRKFTLAKEIFQSISLNKLAQQPLANREQTVSNALAKPLAEPLANVASSSSNINILKTTTTSEQEKQDVDPKWFEIDFEPLANIGFTETHLIQLAKQKILSIEQVQNSIYAFAFDLEHNEKAKDIKGNAMNYFMGIVRKGLPYTYPANYESPRDRETRLYVERMKELERKRVEMQKEALNLAFKEWFYKLPDNEVRKILPSNFPYTTGNIKGSILVENAIKEHFSREIWANRQLEIINEGSNNAKDLSQVSAEEIE